MISGEDDGPKLCQSSGSLERCPRVCNVWGLKSIRVFCEEGEPLCCVLWITQCVVWARTWAEVEKKGAEMLGSVFGRTDFSRIFVFGRADFFADLVAGFFLLIFVGKSAQKNPPGKSPAKSSKFYTTKILRHISADWPGQEMVENRLDLGSEGRYPSNPHVTGHVLQNRQYWQRKVKFSQCDMATLGQCELGSVISVMFAHSALSHLFVAV